MACAERGSDLSITVVLCFGCGGSWGDMAASSQNPAEVQVPFGWFEESEVETSSSEEEEVVAQDPSEAFLDYLVQLQKKGKIHSNDVCILAHWATKAGAKGERLEKVAMAPGKASGNYSRHLSKAMQIEYPVGLYLLQCPGHKKLAAGRVTVSLPLLPLHELVAKELEENTAATAELSTAVLPPAYKDHPVVRNHPKKIRLSACSVLGRCSSDSQRWPFGYHCDELDYLQNMGGGIGEEIQPVPLWMQRLVYNVVPDEMVKVVLPCAWNRHLSNRTP